MAFRLAAFTRQPVGRVGQPFYGWFDEANPIRSGRFSGPLFSSNALPLVQLDRQQRRRFQCLL